ncbi:hypothetical protein C9374_011534 [Naegleria lovaniensis]|uniref:CENP-V/GFA domain-containing protein n=1 Tax=Naegleria lovaniensis TaxID=51637 RepID=A0AA88H362_NAELO|nr:uncharacterized protein C9374_011534 [Naegleria lovaniensis]KAG2392809.1 hypothetical protein C9374_011534 [Naegleria lovaniensis]
MTELQQPPTASSTTATNTTTINEDIIRTGSCRCGHLRFAVKGNSYEYCSLCHCRCCRLGTSAPVSLVIGVPKDKFEWISGREHALKVCKISETFEGYYCGDCGGYVAQGGQDYPFMSTLVCVFDDIKKEFCPRDKFEQDEGMKQFFTPKDHVNYENRVIDFHDELPKYMDFPGPFGSGRIYGQE